MDNDKYKNIFWEEKSNAPANRIVSELEHYCDKYGVQLYDRPLNFEFVLELIEKVENGKKQTVYNPSHYNIEGRKECIVEMIDKYGFNAVANFALLNSYKYLYRMGLKDGNPSENDFKKAQWYFDWVTEKASELRQFDVFDWKLYNDIGGLLELYKSGDMIAFYLKFNNIPELPWVTVGNWKPVEAKEIGKPQEKIEVANFESDYRKNAVYLEVK